MRRARLALVVLVLAAGSLMAAAIAGAYRARTIARERTTERLLVAARAGAALCKAHLDALAETLRAGALHFESSKDPIDQRLRTLFDRSEHFRILSFTDEDGRALREPLFFDASAPVVGRHHPAVDRSEVAEHLRNVPRDAALRLGEGISAPFMRGDRGPFVILAASFQVRGESHATGDPCHPGSRHVLAAEIPLDWLVARLRVATAGRHEVLLLDEHFRTLGHQHPLAAVPGLGPARSPQAEPIALPGTREQGAMMAAVAPVPLYGWTVLAQTPHWSAVPLLSSLAIVWAAVSLVVLLGAAVVLARTDG